MASRFKKRQSVPPQCFALSLMFICLAGCAKAGDKNAGGQQARGGEMSDLSETLSSLNSASCRLTLDHLDKFQPGRPKSAILKDVQWRGDFYMASEYKGKAVCAIIYELVSDALHGNGGVSMWAIFVDDKFAKFVKPPPVLPDDQEIVGHTKYVDGREEVCRIGLSATSDQRKVSRFSVPPPLKGIQAIS
ncbi:MAG: hypothetical protein ACYC0X_13020 [Pirellulaceae bacterium]